MESESFKIFRPLLKPDVAINSGAEVGKRREEWLRTLKPLKRDTFGERALNQTFRA
jgi:hypothetical protein